MLRLVKRNQVSPGKQIQQRILTLVIALIATAVVIFLLGYNPYLIYKEIVIGSLGSAYQFKETIAKTIPLLIMSLGVTVCFKMNFVNIGAEGQFYMGAMGATYMGLNFSQWPAFLLLPAMFITAFIFGGLWCLIPALLKIKIGTSEVLVTLMMNYIAIKYISFLQYGPWKDPKSKGFPRISTFQDSAVLPSLGGIHIGWLIALFLAVFTYILLNKTKLGYEISVFGKSSVTAGYAGMNITRIVILTVLIGGGLSGIAGMVQASAIEKSLTDQLSVGLGYTAIITAWLGNLSAPVIVVVSFAFAALIQGCATIQTTMQVPSSIAEIIQGVILIFVLSSDLFNKYKFTRIKT